MTAALVEMTEQDFLRAQRLFYRTRFMPKLILGIAVVVAVITALEFVGEMSTKPASALVDVLPLVVVTLAWFWWGGQLIWGAPLESRRYFRQSNMRYPLNYEWGADDFWLHNERVSQRLKWAECLRWAESRDSIILILTEWSFIPLPKRFFPDAELADLRSHLIRVRRVGPKARPPAS